MSAQIVGKCLVCQGDIVVDSFNGEYNRYHCNACGIKYEFVPLSSAVIVQDDPLSKWKKDLGDAVYEEIKRRDEERESRSPLPDRIGQVDVADVACKVMEEARKFQKSFRKSQDEAKKTPRKFYY